MEQLVGTHSNMGSSGNFVHRSMQDNNGMPLVDLFVREVLQNSLDAGTGRGEGFEDFISVDFMTGEFDRRKLNEELSGSTQLLNEAFPEDSYSFLAVRDCNTVGLNGKIEDREYTEGEPLGNFKKLVYEIGEPQNNSGAGGSWGLGKTVYYRIGIGLVLFYSQFKDEDGAMKSRLAAVIIEEDKSNIRYLSAVPDKLRTGIAWWGRNTADGVSIPITDVEHITEILGYFGLVPFDADETGSMVIIPYINVDELNAKSRFTYSNSDNQEVIPYWESSLKENLKAAVQRWYFPRIGNLDYRYGQYLKVSVCGERLAPNSFMPLFKILWEMYRFGSADIMPDGESFCSTNNIQLKSVTLRINNCFENGPDVGKFVYSKINEIRNDGSCLFQTRPYYCININPDDVTHNRPIIPFVRKPGLIINYNVNASWLNKEFNLKENEYIIGIFILDSERKFRADYSAGLTLEDYVRSGEKAQHTEWIDQNIGLHTPKIVDSIKRKIKGQLVDEYASAVDRGISCRQSAYAHRFSKILPPANFGNSPAFANGAGHGEVFPRRHAKKTERSELILDYENLKYGKGRFVIKGELRLGKNPGIITISLSVNSDGGDIPLGKWLDDDGLEAPFEIEEIEMVDKTVRINYMYSLNQKIYAAWFDLGNFSAERVKAINVAVSLKIYNQDFSPSIVMKESNGEKNNE